MKRTKIRIALLGALAVALVAALFVGSGYFKKNSSGGSPVEGKLSGKLREFETEFRDVKTRWNQNEKAFVAGEKDSIAPLAKLNQDLLGLASRASELKGESEVEKAALPHLVASVQAIAAVPQVLMLRQIHPPSVSDAQMADLKAKLELGNRQWLEWIEATKTLSR